MSLIRWAPMDMFSDMDDMFNRLPAMMPSQMKAFVPPLDMYETDTAVVVELPLAGVRPEDVAVSVQKGVLVVKGEQKKEHEVEEKNYYRKEVRAGSFYREIALPSPVVEDGVTAEFEGGILKITAPKAQPATVKKVEVKIVQKNSDKN